MTATVSVVVRKAENVLRVPAAALRFRPEGFQRAQSRTAASGGGPGAAAQGTALAARAGAGRSGGERADRERPAGGWPAAAMAAERAAAGGNAAGAGTGERRWPGRPSTVFALDEKAEPNPLDVRIGVSDGQFVEVREGLEEGAVVVTGTEMPGASAAGAGQRPGSSPSSNPFQPQFQRRQR
jgi:HlyD family secretion protein